MINVVKSNGHTLNVNGEMVQKWLIEMKLKLWMSHGHAKWIIKCEMMQ